MVRAAAPCYGKFPLNTIRIPGFPPIVAGTRT